MSCVLYRATFPNDKMYFGITENFEVRVKQHLQAAAAGVLNKMHAAIRKYGNPKFERLCVGNREYIAALECVSIAKFDTLNRGYNMTVGGDGIDRERAAEIGELGRAVLRKKREDKTYNQQYIAARSADLKRATVKLNMLKADRENAERIFKAQSDNGKANNVKLQEALRAKCADPVYAAEFYARRAEKLRKTFSERTPEFWAARNAKRRATLAVKKAGEKVE